MNSPNTNIQVKIWYKLKLIFLIFFGPNTLNFPYISEELTDKYHLRKSILACNKKMEKIQFGVNFEPFFVCTRFETLLRKPH